LPNPVLKHYLQQVYVCSAAAYGFDRVFVHVNITNYVADI